MNIFTFNYIYLPSFLTRYFDLSEKWKIEVCEVENKEKQLLFHSQKNYETSIMQSTYHHLFSQYKRVIKEAEDEAYICSTGLCVANISIIAYILHEIFNVIIFTELRF